MTPYDVEREFDKPTEDGYGFAVQRKPAISGASLPVGHFLMWKQFLILLLSTSLIVLPSAATGCSKSVRQDQAEAHRQAGAALAAKGDWSGAIKEYDEAIKLDPKSDLAYQNRGYAYLKSGDVDRAITDLLAAVDLGPDRSQNYYYRGMAYRAKGNLPNALGDLSRAIGDRSTSRWVEALYERGLAYEAHGDPGDARADFDRIVQLESGASDAVAKSWLEKAQTELAKLGH